MRILVEQGTDDCLNTGDMAMLQVAVTRLKRVWPGAEISIITDNPTRLALLFPGARPITASGRRNWFSDRILLGRLHDHVPPALSREVVRLKRGMRRHTPRLLALGLKGKLRLVGSGGRQFQEFISAVDRADLLVFAGQAGLNDESYPYAMAVLGLIDMARQRGVPVIMFGQGIGPLVNKDLVALAKSTLPFVSMIALREGRTAIPILKDVGVDLNKVVVTGDDAIEFAYDGRSGQRGCCVGINLRVTRSTGVGQDFIGVLRPVLHQFASVHKVRLVPIPIALHKNGTYDPDAIKSLLQGHDSSSDGGSNLDTPCKVIEQVARCRIVVTGAYHVAVFALAQGIPAVGLVRTEYSASKFRGLADQFGGGVHVVNIDAERFSEDLMKAMDIAWECPEEERNQLLKAAERQIESGCNAYERGGQIFARKEQADFAGGSTPGHA